MAQLVNEVNFTQTGSNSYIQNTNPGTTIYSAGELTLKASTTGVEFNQAINQSGSITNCINIDGEQNTDITFSSRGTQNLLLRSGNVTRATINNAGNVATNVSAYCNVLPTLNTEFINYNTFVNIQTYTPAFQLSSGLVSVSYSDRGGRFLQFGNMVYFTCYVRLSALSYTVPTASVRITTPITPPNGGFITSLIVGWYDDLNSLSDVALLTAQISAGVPRSYFVFNKKSDNTSDNLSLLLVSEITSTFKVVVSGSYYLF